MLSLPPELLAASIRVAAKASGARPRLLHASLAIAQTGRTMAVQIACHTFVACFRMCRMDDLTSIQELLPTAHTGVWHARFKTVVAGAQQNEPNRQDLVNCFDQHPEIEVLVLNTEKGEHSRAIQALTCTAYPACEHRHGPLPVPLWMRRRSTMVPRVATLLDRESPKITPPRSRQGQVVYSASNRRASYGYSELCVSGAVNQASGMDFMAAIDVAGQGGTATTCWTSPGAPESANHCCNGWLKASQIRQSGLCVIW